MASDESFSNTAITLPVNEGGPTDKMGKLTQEILDDVFYNIIHGIVLKTHRDEKIARANSAAIIVSLKAAKLDARSSSSSTSKKSARVSTESAIFEDSQITIIGNPLKNLPAKEIRCPKCNLPRLLHPTSGNTSQPSDSNIKYCTKHPFIDKPGHDIYGQSFPIDTTGPGKGKKKSQVPKIGGLGTAEGTDTGNSFDSPAASPPPSTQPISPNTFPNVKCPGCARSLAIKRFAGHLGKCIGSKGRPSGRAALLKMNGSGLGSSQTSNPSPPGSRRATPVPSKKTGSLKREREADEFDEIEDSEEEPTKKKRKFPSKKKENVALGKAASGSTKKWKSGRIDGKIKLTLSNGRVSASAMNSDAEPEAELEDKLLKPAVDKTESVSSQTLSSPS